MPAKPACGIAVVVQAASVRALLDPAGPDPTTPEGLHERYRPAAATWVRANFVTSADGAATLDGRSGGLGNAADQAVFAVLRDHADVVLVGAGTVRDESYGGIHPTAESRARRTADGRAEVPVLAVVGRPSRLSGQERWITEATAPPLLLTSADEAREVPGCQTVVCGARTVDVLTALDRLAARGLRSVLCEGGPSLFAHVAGAGRLDELCLSYSPVLAGPGPGRIMVGEAWDTPRRATLAGLLEDNALLLARYLL